MQKILLALLKLQLFWKKEALRSISDCFRVNVALIRLIWLLMILHSHSVDFICKILHAFLFLISTNEWEKMHFSIKTNAYELQGLFLN